MSDPNFKENSYISIDNYIIENNEKEKNKTNEIEINENNEDHDEISSTNDPSLEDKET